MILLEKEFERLKKITGVGTHLRLLWIPLEDSDRHGEVKGDAIVVYDKDEEVAVRTLRHEFVDHFYVKDVVDPLVKFINLQKNLIDNLIYERKEVIVDKIVELLSDDESLVVSELLDDDLPAG
jgi:hypothetical protein